LPRIPQQTVEAIKHKASIDAVIGHYIPVIKKGSSYRAVCPFHDDHDPSLNISVDKQIFKCFVCGAAGDVFSFVEKYEHVDYVTAIKKVADLIGYPLDLGAGYASAHAFQETPEHKAVKEAVLFCQHELASAAGQSMMEYLKKRQLPQAQIEKYQFGYNPGHDALYNFLSKKGFSDEVLIKAGLCRLTDKGVQDIFYQRLMIPIHDRQGHAIGFTARTLDPQALAKYINTAETPLFHKSNVIFNWHRAYDQARDKGTVILTEGPMDVMAFDRAGMSNAVCTMGTSGTTGQLAALRQMTGRILLAYDGDSAGQKAIWHVGQMALAAGLQVSVLRNSTNLDPDDIVRQKGPGELTAMAQHPYSWMEFVMTQGQKAFDLTDYAARKQFAQQTMAQINQLNDEFDRANWTQQLAALTGFSPAALGLLKGPEATLPARAASPAPRIKPQLMDGVKLAELTIIRQMLGSSQAAAVYKDQLNTLRDPDATDLARLIVDWYAGHDGLQTDDFVSSLPEDRLRDVLFEANSSPLVNDRLDMTVLRDAIAKMKLDRLDDQIRAKMAQMRQYSDPSVKARVGEELVGLRRKQLEIRKEMEQGGMAHD